MRNEKFENSLSRAVAFGGLGCAIPFSFLFYWIGFSSIEKWLLYVVVSAFFIALGFVNKTREMLSKAELKIENNNNFLRIMKFISVLVAFFIGSILSAGFVLTFLLFFRGI
jgi:hypothetical protein